MEFKNILNIARTVSEPATEETQPQTSPTEQSSVLGTAKDSIERAITNDFGIVGNEAPGLPFPSLDDQTAPGFQALQTSRDNLTIGSAADKQPAQIFDELMKEIQDLISRLPDIYRGSAQGNFDDLMKTVNQLIQNARTEVDAGPSIDGMSTSPSFYENAAAQAQVFPPEAIQLLKDFISTWSQFLDPSQPQDASNVPNAPGQRLGIQPNATEPQATGGSKLLQTNAGDFSIVGEINPKQYYSELQNEINDLINKLPDDQKGPAKTELFFLETKVAQLIYDFNHFNGMQIGDGIPPEAIQLLKDFIDKYSQFLPH